MARTTNRLTATKLTTKTPGRYADGGNLYLQVTLPKSKPKSKGSTTKKERAPFRSWLFIYKSPKTRVYRMMGLGRASDRDVDLSKARKKAAALRALLAEHIDPLDARQADKEAARAVSKNPTTFKEFAGDYIADHKTSWKNSTHAKQWEQSLRDYAYPAIGNLDVAAITVNDVMKVLRPIWHTKTETAARLRGRIENILGAAKVSGKRTGDNPAAWHENLEELLPSPKKIKTVKHHPALAYTDAPQFVKELRERDGISARALEFLILCATRTNEIIGAVWDEIDLDEKLWIIPKHRMKAKRDHIVPLPDRAVAILKRLPREKGNPHVFIGGKEGLPLSDMAMLELVKEMRPGITVHGFRSTFKDWAAEETSHANIVTEMALAHTIGDKTEAAYRRGDLLKKRRRLMDDWARYCERLASDKHGIVTPFRKKKAS